MWGSEVSLKGCFEVCEALGPRVLGPGLGEFRVVGGLMFWDLGNTSIGFSLSGQVRGAGPLDKLKQRLERR